MEAYSNHFRGKDKVKKRRPQGFSVQITKSLVLFPDFRSLKSVGSDIGVPCIL